MQLDSWNKNYACLGHVFPIYRILQILQVIRQTTPEKCRAANNGQWLVITGHFCVLTYQIFLYCSVSICYLVSCLLSIKVSGSLSKAFLEQHYLKAVKLWHNDENCRLKQKKKEIRKRKATKWTQENFELLSLFDLLSLCELLSDNDLLTWVVLWVYILKS